MTQYFPGKQQQGIGLTFIATTFFAIFFYTFLILLEMDLFAKATAFIVGITIAAYVWNLFKKQNLLLNDENPPEHLLWFVKNGRLTPKQGELLVFTIVIIHLCFSVFVSYIILGSNNIFTVFLFCILITIGLFFGKREFYHWFPIYLFLAMYDMLSIFQQINVYHFTTTNFYAFDTTLFGWAFGGIPPSYYFYTHHIAILDVVCGLFYVFHVIIPPIVILYLRIYHEDKFDRMAWSSLYLVIISIGFFIFMPTAPPWYTYNFGYSAVDISLVTIDKATAGLWYTDQALGTTMLSKMMWNMTSAKFAAFPSMHVAAPTFIYFSCKKAGIKKLTPYLALYIVIIMFSVIYLNHHWVADVLGGFSFAGLSVALSNHLYGNNVKKKSELAMTV